MQVGLKVEGVEQAISALHATASQIQYAGRLALNRTSDFMKKTLVSVMQDQAFDRPTPWTLRSLYVERATKEKPTAGVYFIDQATKGVPGGRFLRPEIMGGPRPMKSAEKAVGGYLMPSLFMPLDRYGNVRGSEFVRMMSHLYLHKDMLQNVTGSRRSTSKRAQLEYFRRGNMIWQKKGARSALPAWVISRTPPAYRRRFYFYQIGEDVALRTIDKEMTQAINDAIKWNK